MAKLEIRKTFLAQVPIRGWVEVEMDETNIYYADCARQLAEYELTGVIRKGLYLGVTDDELISVREKK